ncbi:hypothetical protein C6369_006920 [Rhodococcus rhodochrous]|nr:hypothetical protein C6369_006920 [Rhodococcus rhodochrous]
MVEHPIVRVDTNDRVQCEPHVLRDVGLSVLAETVYRGMATGQPWGRGRRLRDPKGLRSVGAVARRAPASFLIEFILVARTRVECCDRSTGLREGPT